MSNDNENSKGTIEMKQAFLASAISDISSYVQLADTKVSIIMAAMMALIAAVISCYEPILYALDNIRPCSWIGVTIIILSILLIISVVSVFVFGILTIQGHSSTIDYESKWFLPKSTKSYSWDNYKTDVNDMTDKDIIENMAAELYKLNDINRQKAKTNKKAIRSFSVALIVFVIICILIVVSAL